MSHLEIKLHSNQPFGPRDVLDFGQKVNQLTLAIEGDMELTVWKFYGQFVPVPGEAVPPLLPNGWLNVEIFGDKLIIIYNQQEYVVTPVSGTLTATVWVPSDLEITHLS